MFFPGATLEDSRIHDNKVPDILKCSCGYHSNTRQHVRTCQICNIVYPIKIVDVAFMVFQELGDQQWQIIYYNPFLLTRNPTIYNIIRKLAGQWDKRLVDQASDVPS